MEERNGAPSTSLATGAHPRGCLRKIRDLIAERDEARDRCRVLDRFLVSMTGELLALRRETGRPEAVSPGALLEAHRLGANAFAPVPAVRVAEPATSTASARPGETPGLPASLQGGASAPPSVPVSLDFWPDARRSTPGGDVS